MKLRVVGNANNKYWIETQKGNGGAEQDQYYWTRIFHDKCFDSIYEAETYARVLLEEDRKRREYDFKESQIIYSKEVS